MSPMTPLRLIAAIAASAVFGVIFAAVLPEGPRVAVVEPGAPGTQLARHVVRGADADYAVIPLRGAECLVVYVTTPGQGAAELVPGGVNTGPVPAAPIRFVTDPGAEPGTVTVPGRLARKMRVSWDGQAWAWEARSE